MVRVDGLEGRGFSHVGFLHLEVKDLYSILHLEVKDLYSILPDSRRVFLLYIIIIIIIVYPSHY